ncbi:hypothetical protein GCM10023212_14020 [Luteolibacter yonseiensis]
MKKMEEMGILDMKSNTNMVKPCDDGVLEEMVRRLARTDAWLSRLRPAPHELRASRGLRGARRRCLRR